VGRKYSAIELSPGVIRNDWLYCIDNPYIKPIIGTPILCAERFVLDPTTNSCELGEYG
jgi:hypothetical protein